MTSIQASGALAIGLFQQSCITTHEVQLAGKSLNMERSTITAAYSLSAEQNGDMKTKAYMYPIVHSSCVKVFIVLTYGCIPLHGDNALP